MRESELLAHIEARSRALAGRGAIVVGPGDDCAVLSLPGLTLATVDQLVAGRHYRPEEVSIDQIARKAIARSVSDIAAMGGTPLCGLATGCLPRGFGQGDELFERMAHWASEWGCPLAGGDIATGDGPLVLTVTVLGRAHQTRGPVLQSTARPGDKVYITGKIGGAVRSGRHLSFEPRISEGAWLCGTLGERLHAMIDLSDGLGRDAGRLAKASGVRIEIDAAAIPLHADAGEWRTAAAEGEDYELLFAAAPDSSVPATTKSATPVTCVGRVLEGEGCFIVDGRDFTRSDELGWEHT